MNLFSILEGSKLSTAVASKSKPPAASVTGKHRYQAPKMAPSVGTASKQLVPNITGKGKQSTPKMSVKFKEPVMVINEETQPKIEHLSENVKSRKESKKLGNIFFLRFPNFDIKTGMARMINKTCMQFKFEASQFWAFFITS